MFSGSDPAAAKSGYFFAGIAKSYQ